MEYNVSDTYSAAAVPHMGDEVHVSLIRDQAWSFSPLIKDWTAASFVSFSYTDVATLVEKRPFLNMIASAPLTAVKHAVFTDYASRSMKSSKYR